MAQSWYSRAQMKRGRLKAMIRLLSSLARSEDGATLVEYAIVVSLIAIVGILAVTKLGTVTASHIGSAADGI